MIQIFREAFKVNRSEAFGGLDKVANQGGQGAGLGSFDNGLDERDLGGAASSSQEGGEDDLFMIIIMIIYLVIIEVLKH